MLRNTTKELIQKYRKLIEHNEFDVLFRKIQAEFVPTITCEFCSALISAGIDFLKHMTYIPEGCFIGATFEKFTIPSNIEKICWKAFMYSDLQNIVIPSNIKIVEAEGFSACYDLRHVIFDEGCTRIDSYCFASCDSLKTITLPSTLVELDEGIFNGCPDTLTIKYNGIKDQWNKILKHNYAFSGCEVDSVTCSDGVVIVS